MIYFDDECMKVGGIVLPGIYKSIEVKHSAKVEEQQVEGSDSKPKQATGYEDAKINIELLLIDSSDKTKYQKLETIQSIFKKSDQEKPEVMEIISEQTSIRGIRNVIFKDLTSKEQNTKDTITVTLEFWQYVPVEITVSQNNSSGSSSSSSSSSSSNSSSSSSGSSSSSSGLSSEYESYLSSTRGKAPAIGDKSSSSPAQERGA